MDYEMDYSRQLTQLEYMNLSPEQKREISIFRPDLLPPPVSVPKKKSRKTKAK